MTFKLHNPLGKGGVECSIHSGGTTKFLEIIAISDSPDRAGLGNVRGTRRENGRNRGEGGNGGTCAECAGEYGRNRGRGEGGKMCAERAGENGRNWGEGGTGGTCAERAGVRRWRSGEGGKLTESHGGVFVSADEMADAAEADPLARVGIQLPRRYPLIPRPGEGLPPGLRCNGCGAVHQAAPKPGCVHCPMAGEVIPCALMTRVRAQNSLSFPAHRLPWSAECKLCLRQCQAILTMKPRAGCFT